MRRPTTFLLASASMLCGDVNAAQAIPIANVHMDTRRWVRWWWVVVGKCRGEVVVGGWVGGGGGERGGVCGEGVGEGRSGEVRGGVGSRGWVEPDGRLSSHETHAIVRSGRVRLGAAEVHAGVGCGQTTTTRPPTRPPTHPRTHPPNPKHRHVIHAPKARAGSHCPLCVPRNSPHLESWRSSPRAQKARRRVATRRDSDSPQPQATVTRRNRKRRRRAASGGNSDAPHTAATATRRDAATPAANEAVGDGGEPQLQRVLRRVMVSKRQGHQRPMRRPRKGEALAADPDASARDADAAALASNHEALDTEATRGYAAAPTSNHAALARATAGVAASAVASHHCLTMALHVVRKLVLRRTEDSASMNELVAGGVEVGGGGRVEVEAWGRWRWEDVQWVGEW